MTDFEQAKGAYDALLVTLAETQEARATVAARLAETEAKLPGLEAEKARLTKAAALGKADKTETAKLGQARRELADAQADLDSLNEQLALFEPAGDIMHDVLVRLDTAYQEMEAAHQATRRSAYDAEFAALKAAVTKHMPRLLALSGNSDADDILVDLCTGIRAATDAMPALPHRCGELYTYQRAQSEAAEKARRDAWKNTLEERKNTPITFSSQPRGVQL